MIVENSYACSGRRLKVGWCKVCRVLFGYFSSLDTYILIGVWLGEYQKATPQKHMFERCWTTSSRLINKFD